MRIVSESLMVALTSFSHCIFADAPKSLDDLRRQLLFLTDQMGALQASADSEGRELTEDEQRKFDAQLQDFDRIQADLQRRESLEARTQALGSPAGRQTAPERPTNFPASARARVDVGVDLASTRGWDTWGDFCSAVKAAYRPGAQMDPRLRNSPSTYGSEGVGPDGGFAVPPDMTADIWKKVARETSLLGLSDKKQTSSNSVTVPKDETTPWGTGGVRAYWEGEAAQGTQSKLLLEQATVRLSKLMSNVPMTEELMEDAPFLGSYLSDAVSTVFDYTISEAILRGTGAGQPVGILKSPSLVSVAKESSQVADTIVAENIMKMWSRCYAPSRRNAVWLINQDCEPQLMQMAFKIKNVAGTENVGGYPLYIPAGGLSAAPYGTLLGRPVIPTQACSTVGDQGDIILADMSEYLTVTKASGIRSDVSIHLFFDYAVTTYRFILRLGGQPWWSNPITPRDGNNTLSPFVTLDARS